MASSLQFIMEESQERRLEAAAEAEPMEGHCFLACSACSDTACSRQGPPTPILIKKILQICAQANRFHFPRQLVSIKLKNKQKQPTQRNRNDLVIKSAEYCVFAKHR